MSILQSLRTDQGLSLADLSGAVGKSQAVLSRFFNAEHLAYPEELGEALAPLLFLEPDEVRHIWEGQREMDKAEAGAVEKIHSIVWEVRELRKLIGELQATTSRGKPKALATKLDLALGNLENKLGTRDQVAP